MRRDLPWWLNVIAPLVLLMPSEEIPDTSSPAPPSPPEDKGPKFIPASSHERDRAARRRARRNKRKKGHR